jgi:hypothetical protein
MVLLIPHKNPPMLVYAFTQSSDRILPSLPAFDTNYPLSKRKLMFQAICLFSILVCWWGEAGGLSLKFYQHTFDIFWSPREWERSDDWRTTNNETNFLSSEMQRSVHCFVCNSSTRWALSPLYLLEIALTQTWNFPSKTCGISITRLLANQCRFEWISHEN